VNASLELWGGVECTVNRVGNVWRDQVQLSGHDARLDDLDLIADLGIRTLRYPVLWERTETAPGVFDWRWADARLARLRELGIRPVVGLVHHGSGPDWTDLLDDAGFARGLARFAGAAAARYPWVTDWTPVNEPLTTARFSCMYGHWHPHRRDEGDFWRALLNQMDAVRLAMHAIRAVTPAARLIQTEDFGVTSGTPPCRDQIRHENLRRLATWDLLEGQVTPDHGHYAHIGSFGLQDRLDAFRADPCPADVIGLNHYATSDRFLDHRLARYPTHSHGGNGQIAYADVAAVRVLEAPMHGWTWLLDQLWTRYGRSIAVTECHLGCSADQQIRWLADCWQAAQAARLAGVAVEAVTVWALLGSHDWNSLLTRTDGHYEPGALDVSSGVPRPTTLANAVAHLAKTGGLRDAPAHCEMAPVGWWRTPERFEPAPA
jgi:dTDP-4-dehydrorhamnose reductase